MIKVLKQPNLKSIIALKRKFHSTAAKNAGLTEDNKKLTNHSVRKTSISRLLDVSLSENYVVQLNGHENFQSQCVRIIILHLSLC